MNDFYFIQMMDISSKIINQLESDYKKWHNLVKTKSIIDADLRDLGQVIAQSSFLHYNMQIVSYLINFSF